MVHNYRAAVAESLQPATTTGDQLVAATMVGDEASLLIDDQLIAATMAGDEAAFAELFARYKRMVAAIGGRFFQRREQIEEIVQVSFCQAFLALNQYHGGQERSFAAWLKRIAINTCLDELKRNARRKESLISELDDGEREYLQERMLPRPTKPDAEQQTISRDLAHKLLAQLKPEDRIALTLLYEEEWSVAEIGALLDWTVPKVKMRAYQARLALRQFIKGNL